MNLISYEEFETLLKGLKEQELLNEKHSKAFEVLLEDNFGFFDGGSKITSAIYNFLNSHFSDESDWIGYFMFDLDFGTKYRKGCILDSDKNEISLKTIKDLYNLLIENANNKSS